MNNIKTKIRIRDNWTCYRCNIEQKSIHIHHIIPTSVGGLDIPENMICLCEKCHKFVDNEYIRNGKTNFVDNMLKTAEIRTAMIELEETIHNDIQIDK